MAKKAGPVFIKSLPMSTTDLLLAVMGDLVSMAARYLKWPDLVQPGKPGGLPHRMGPGEVAQPMEFQTSLVLAETDQMAL